MSAMHAAVELKLTQLHEQLTAIIAARVHPKHGAYMCKKYKYGRCCFPKEPSAQTLLPRSS
jgi:hypothetical protein